MELANCLGVDVQCTTDPDDPEGQPTQAQGRSTEQVSQVGI